MSSIEENARINLAHKLIEIQENVLPNSAYTRARYNSQDVKDTFNNVGNKTELIAGSIPYVSGIGAPIAGYRVGDRLGHPIAGFLGGREAVVGAASNNTKDVSIGDVYTTKNMRIKAVNAAVPGAIIGGIAGGPIGAAAGAAIGGTVGATIIPGVRYGYGKLFGKRYGKPTPEQQQQFQQQFQQQVQQPVQLQRVRND